MIKATKIQVFGWESALRGMRNPLDSWDKSDTDFTHINVNSIGISYPLIGFKDLSLMKRLFVAGTEHAKYLRMIHVQMDITAPMYWFSEYDTYKVSTVANSTSKMHTLTKSPFSKEMFSTDHLNAASEKLLDTIIAELNNNRALYTNTKNKTYWWQLIQLLPESFNQTRTVDFNYQTAINMINQRRNHKLDEWNIFVNSYLMKLPYIQYLVNRAIDLKWEDSSR